MPAVSTSAVLAQVHQLAATATSKLQFEADQQEHCLRRMVLTANLIDDLTEEIHNLKLRTRDSAAGRQTGLRWADRVAKDLQDLELQNDDAGHDDDESDSSSEPDDEALTPPTTPEKDQVPFDSEKMETFFDLDDVAELALTRVPSNIPHQKQGAGAQARITVVEVEMEDSAPDSVTGQVAIISQI